MLTTLSLVGMVLAVLLCFLAGDTRLVRSLSGRQGYRRLEAALSPRWLLRPRAAIGVMLLGAGLRLFQMLRAAQAILPEEMLTALQARALLEGGKSLAGLPWPAMLPGWLGEGNGPFQAWLAMIPLALTGNIVLALRLPMLVASCLCMFALWDMVRRAFSPGAALAALTLLALSPWQTMQSRWTLSWQWLPVLLLLALWLLTLPRRRAWGFFGAVLLLGLAMYTGDTAWAVVPLFVVTAFGYLLYKKRLRLRVVLPGFLLFALMATPALAQFAVQTFDLPDGRVLGMSVVRHEESSHAGQLVGLQPKTVTTLYARPDMPAQEGYGPQLLPFLRDNPHVATLYTDLFNTAYRALQSTVLQYVEDPGYTTAHFLPEYGYLYLFMLPFTLLGAVRLLVTATAKGKNRRGTARENGRFLRGLLLCWVLASLPFLLLFLNLDLMHYALLFFPLLLLSAYGLWYVILRFRPAWPVVLALLLLSTVGFQTAGYDDAAAFPGLSEALEHSAGVEAEQVYVTTRLYPNDQPHRAAAAETIWAYDLPVAYVRGEEALAGQLPYFERFQYTYFPGHTMDHDLDAVYVMHRRDMDTLDVDEGYDLIRFGEYVVLTPQG